MKMSEKEEDYLKVIYELSKNKGYVRSIEISESLNVKPASVTDMLKKLQDKGYIKYEKYRGIVITESGERIARKIVHRWEIIRQFFEIFGVNEENAESIANKVEHYIDDDSFERIEKFVKFVDSFKENPKWLEHFQEFIKSGKLPDCDKIQK